jgi:hypothetical protein
VNGVSIARRLGLVLLQLAVLLSAGWGAGIAACGDDCCDDHCRSGDWHAVDYHEAVSGRGDQDGRFALGTHAAQSNDFAESPSDQDLPCGSSHRCAHCPCCQRLQSLPPNASTLLAPVSPSNDGATLRFAYQRWSGVEPGRLFKPPKVG